VASYLARARGSNEPELSITRVKDLEQFIRECEAFQMDHGHVLGDKCDEKLETYRRRFEELLGNANGRVPPFACSSHFLLTNSDIQRTTACATSLIDILHHLYISYPPYTTTLACSPRCYTLFIDTHLTITFSIIYFGNNPRTIHLAMQCIRGGRYLSIPTTDI
jgi:hypothetical protein